MNDSTRLESLPHGRTTRLLAKAFPDCPPDRLFVSSEPWPELDGCFGILCTARSGSTYLCRELERRYAVGQVGESLNPPTLLARARKAGLASPAAALRHTINVYAERGWFGFKSALNGVMIGEASGLLPHYWQKTRFLHLFRRDIVAQAVSMQKAKLSGRYHVKQKEKAAVTETHYSYTAIAQHLTAILKGTRVIAEYLARAGRPFARVFYEDFEHGDFLRVETECARLGFPLREALKANEARIVERISDAVNQEWRERFRAEMDDSARATLQAYEGCWSNPAFAPTRRHAGR